jgi:membrane-bound serine protease (ClpP class)
MRRRHLMTGFFASLLVIAALLPAHAALSDNGGSVVGNVALIKIDGSINPGSAGFILDAIEKAAQEGDAALILQLDTPGGLVDSTRDIVKGMLAARIPIIVYVAPDGARAGSAGVFITLAGHVAAMAPSTNIGAAHPVTIGGGGLPGQGEEEKDKEKQKSNDEEMARKIVNDTAAFMEVIAERRHRNVDWAVKAVRESVSITAKKALELKVIDLIAADIPELLKMIDGREIELGADHKVVLHTAGARVHEITMSAKEKLVNAFSDPNLSMILMSIGMLGILIEFYHPGTIIPGTIGAISLILGLISFQIVPINYGGLLLMLLGLALIAGELLFTSQGLLGASGGVAFVLGGFLLVDTDSPAFVPGTTGFEISPWVLVPAGITIILLALLLGWAVARVQKARPVSGSEGLVGEVGEARAPVSQAGGQVFVHGEIWKAVAADPMPISSGDPIEVVAVHGMVVTVKKKI